MVDTGTLMQSPTQAHWIARSIGSASTTPALLVLLVSLTLLWISRVDRMVPGVQATLIGAAVLLVGLGCAALAAVRPQRAGLSPPHVMLSLGFGGMLLGLLWDVLDGGADRLASLCSQSASLTLYDSFGCTWRIYPACIWACWLAACWRFPACACCGRIAGATCARCLHKMSCVRLGC